MITVTLSFSLNEARSFFESAGLEVKRAEIPIVFNQESGKPELLSMWTVKDPYSRALEQLDVAFMRCLVKNRNKLIQDIDKMEVYNSFKI